VDGAVLTAIGSPRRREILRLLWEQELPAGAIHQAMPDVTFGAVSLQLKALAEAGLVESRPEGQQRIYRVRREALGPVAAMLEAMWSDALWRLKLRAELKQTRRGPLPGATRPARRRPRRPTRHSKKGTR
jgi:DNA-binding transcriptional ArsR family regulator